jgi:hypothetical protein
MVGYGVTRPRNFTRWNTEPAAYIAENGRCGLPTVGERTLIARQVDSVVVRRDLHLFRLTLRGVRYDATE